MLELKPRVKSESKASPAHGVPLRGEGGSDVVNFIPPNQQMWARRNSHMEWYVYIIKSLKNGRYYIGCSSNIIKRLKQHNQGQNRSTSPHIPYYLIYSEKYNNQKIAFDREKQIKSYKGGKAFKKLLEFNLEHKSVGGGVVNRNRL